VENGSEVRAVEIRYAGVVVGRSTKVRDWNSGGAFIGFAEPLPSGTSLVLRGDGIEQGARVLEVFESADPAVAGMQVKFIGAAATAAPAPRPVAPAAAPVTAPATEPARAPAPAGVTAEAMPVATSAAPSAAPSSAPAEQGDGETGQGEPGGQAGSGGKRRRRRR
jgi:hypothetical protein